MFEQVISSNSISFTLVFLEGLLSFFSPCVIPLIPIYIGYLAGNAKQINQDGTITYQRKQVFFHTIFFILGISFAFFILGMSFSVLGKFFSSNKLIFTRIGGILIVVLGLFQLGILDLKFLQFERMFHIQLGEKSVNPFIAFLMGFTFSFSWTPCVGPALSSVLILASGAKNALMGNLLVLVYAVGFVIPFLVLGLFATQVLGFLKNNQNLLKYTIKASGVLLIVIGVMTFTGWMNGISSYLNSSSLSGALTDSTRNKEYETKTNTTQTTVEETTKPQAQQVIPAIDFTLSDQYGNTHKLSDYKGKVVFLNFWATWCPPCKSEMPHIEELYKEYNLNQDEVVILGVANPKSEKYPNNSDENQESIIKFLKDNNYTFPVVFDQIGSVLSNYYISAFPTTFMIDKQGNIYGYVSGALTKDIMKGIITETLDNTK
jgi:cytochrome c-type biogenesis protein